jgi:hypothetical protein
MFGWIIVTGKKILSTILISFVLYLLTPALDLPNSASLLLIYSFCAGMIFPDIDMITGFLKRALHSMSVFIFLFLLIVIALYPASIQISGDMCTESITYSLTGISGFGAYCNAGTVLIVMIIGYIFAQAIVGWIPDRNMLHSYLMMILVIVCAALFSLFSFEKSLFYPTVISFSVAYFMHISIDAAYHHMRN